jgi:hypothetical protein
VKSVSKAEFRKAQCCGRLAGCDVVWATNAEAWIRNGKILAVKKDSSLGSTYYLEAQQ